MDNIDYAGSWSNSTGREKVIIPLGMWDDYPALKNMLRLYGKENITILARTAEINDFPLYAYCEMW